MKRVHSVHADAIHSYVDSSSATSLRITTDCQSSATGSIPVTLRTLASGRQTGAGIINRGFIVTGPSLSGLYGTVHIWHRNSSTHQSWQPYALSHLPGWGLLGTATVANPPLYLNQACPDLIRLTYLSSPLPYWSHRVIGTRLLQGRRVWLLREQQYSKLDLYVDASSYRLLRLAMWDGTSKNPVHWQVRFDYSRFNESVHLLPYGSQEKRS